MNVTPILILLTELNSLAWASIFLAHLQVLRVAYLVGTIAGVILTLLIETNADEHEMLVCKKCVVIVLAALVATTIAKPVGTVGVSQDTVGNYNLRYDVPGISRSETRDVFGNVNGAFSYYDPYGILRQTQFTSGAHGVHAVGTDIPVPVQDTPEVALAKAEHFAILQAAYLSAPPSPQFFDY
ncbi:hypothetical protein FQA39_LY17170 [Lamprigera yunnana]|nr:hypothetical protein FQA39_LY17170 [Lamprigera yunnana]